ncbi:hypothetical protein WICPIJ_004824 [Wickerhamomyces pijperi]|uniref:Uncharacterized protein n=1 Tax=Wickerhamomyces pijperi TaxID=599730 RepID=A0A9P8TMD4_WICPI|nr:hypothetical protein WICPIJ_004824 [Wickerhamomyces pijperi]
MTRKAKTTTATEEVQVVAGEPMRKYFGFSSPQPHNLIPTFKVGHCQASEAKSSCLSGSGTKALLVAIMAKFNWTKSLRKEVFGSLKSGPGFGSSSLVCSSMFHQVFVTMQVLLGHAVDHTNGHPINSVLNDITRSVVCRSGSVTLEEPVVVSVLVGVSGDLLLLGALWVCLDMGVQQSTAETLVLHSELGGGDGQITWTTADIGAS